MDLTEISREQALMDRDFANIRIIELSARINAAANELQRLRAELHSCQRTAAPAREAHLVPAQPVAAPQSIETASPSRPKRPGLIKRFFAKPTKMLWHIDEVCSRHPSSPKEGIKHSVARSEFHLFSLSGWAVPLNLSVPFTSVEIAIVSDADRIRRQVETRTREDVAAHLSNPMFVRSGFSIEITMAELKPGSYRIELIGRTNDGNEAKAHVVDLDLR
jgi:hypothetical protein